MDAKSFLIVFTASQFIALNSIALSLRIPPPQIDCYKNAVAVVEVIKINVVELGVQCIDNASSSPPSCATAEYTMRILERVNGPSKKLRNTIKLKSEAHLPYGPTEESKKYIESTVFPKYLLWESEENGGKELIFTTYDIYDSKAMREFLSQCKKSIGVTSSAISP